MSRPENLFRSVFLWVFAVLLLVAGGCGKKTDNPTSHTDSVQPSSAVEAASLNPPTDKPLADFQIQLLDIAFKAASAIPVNPFIKDRSRAQQEVVTASLILDQPIRAVRYADQIENWRRGLCYAKASLYLASKGYAQEHIKPGLDLAERIAALDHGQQWRSDRIKAVVSQVYALLGQHEQADRFRTGLVQPEEGDMMETDTFARHQLPFEEQLKILDEAVGLGHFDLAKGLMGSYTVLYNRYYDDLEKRQMIKEKIAAAWESMKLPVTIRLETLTRLIPAALDHGDNAQALELIQEAQQYLDAYQWTLQSRIPAVAKLAELRFRAGDEQNAWAEVDAALALYQEKQDAITDIYRAGTLRPLGETYQRMNHSDAARKVYRLALEAGLANPNFQPRATDFSATCSSMALSALEPDASLWGMIHQIQKELKLL